MSSHQWQFASRFRRNSFGWRSQTPIKRIKEAVAEIRKVARKEPNVAALGAISFLAKLSPAIEQVDSSSGAIGTAVNYAIEALVPIISKATVPDQERNKWLERLWKAVEADNIPYLEYLEEFWGELCVTPELASVWADEFLNAVKHLTSNSGWFHGTIVCFSALFTAKRYDELLGLLDKPSFQQWHCQCWRIKALTAMHQSDAALACAEKLQTLKNMPKEAIAVDCEAILLASGRTEEAFERYAITANQKITNLATFNAIKKKYPEQAPLDILQRLIKSRPGEEGKWFAAAKDAGFFDLAIELVNSSPADPCTLMRAAKEFAQTKPDFAIAAGLASLYWMLNDYGYELTNFDVFAAYHAIMQAAKTAGIPAEEIKIKINNLVLNTPASSGRFTREILIKELKL